MGQSIKPGSGDDNPCSSEAAPLTPQACDVLAKQPSFDIAQRDDVALPRAISAWLVEPSRKVVSVSGDGGLLQSSMELETAVWPGANVWHIIWVDGKYNRVAMQEEKKYQPVSGVEFGAVDFKACAGSFGAAGFALERAEQPEPTLRNAIDLHAMPWRRRWSIIAIIIC